jgi:hypothetical protein
MTRAIANTAHDGCPHAGISGRPGAGQHQPPRLERDKGAAGNAAHLPVGFEMAAI